MTDLRFVGDWGLARGAFVALALGACAWALYRRETRSHKGATSWLLPALRAAVVAMLVLMLTGPALHHRRVIGQLARILLFVDASRSMSAADDAMEPGRKLLEAARRGWISDKELPRNLLAAQKALERASRMAAQAGAEGVEVSPGAVDAREATTAFLKSVEQALEHLQKARPDEDLLAPDDTGAGRPKKSSAAERKKAKQRGERSSEAVREEFRRNLLTPAGALAKEARSKDRNRLVSDLVALSQKAADWGRRLRSAFERQAQRLAESGSEEARQAIERFDGLNRWQRMQALLLEGDKPLLAELAARHNVELVAFSGADGQPPCLWLWRGRAGREEKSGDIPKTLASTPAGEATDIGLALNAALGASGPDTQKTRKPETPNPKPETPNPKPETPMAAVILSDGQHNYSAAGDSPLQLAKICGNRGIPVFTVGAGSQRRMGDMAVARVDAPRSVFHKDRVKGAVALKDDMPAGKPFTLRIICEGQTLWEKNLTTAGEHDRNIDFDFPVEKYLEEKLSGKPKDIAYRSVPLNLRAVVSGPDTTGAAGFDKEPANNERTFHVQAIFQRNRVLILEDRPRWEFRYIRNLFDRDERWETTALLVDPTAPNGGIQRASGPDQTAAFPADRESLFAYDLILMGDFPPGLLQPKELEWIRDFVASRGGGLILIDGQRGNLRHYDKTPLDKLIPVAWTGETAGAPPSALRLTEKGKLRLTDRGMGLSALALASDAKENLSIWDSLKPPHWLAPVAPQPGAEVLLEATIDNEANPQPETSNPKLGTRNSKLSQASPALVLRRYGAGKVLYAAFDESWRFRYRVGDLYHERYWNQVGGWIMPPPFAVNDRFVSLDAGELTYSPGQKVEIRARVRDAEGKPVTNKAVRAQLFRDGKKVAVALLDPDEEREEYRGKTGPLEKGNYEVRLEVAGYSEDKTQAKAEFYVLPPDAGEMAELTCDEELLREMAAKGGGEYFREEDAQDLADRLQPLSEGIVIETETLLGQSYWWFVPIVVLLAAEWILRKRSGML